jgi:8-oxo-dGTP pyrophosphatase MutT (NUDIX family)
VTVLPPAARTHTPRGVHVVRIARLDLTFAPCAWPFAEAWRAAIDTHFAGLRRQKPALFNGRVLLMHRFAVSEDAFHGAYLETDYASFLAWRDWDFPDKTMHNCFGMGAVRSSDGAFLLGVMGSHTANAGKVYFPAGTPEPRDVVDGVVDMDGSVRRELAEETGLIADGMDAQPGWHVIFAGPRIALMKVLRTHETAESLRQRALNHLAGEAQPELAGVRMVCGPADIDPGMPSHVSAFLHHVWQSDRD